ncbi:MAG: AAA-like domain-containing protein [Eubacterium sp.]|nr:AAA-like domain-containing protein [Eubacterium sp.]
MTKSFNTAGDCKPQMHYMVDITKRLKQIQGMIDKGEYFMISRGRQYGKTTTLRNLKQFLEPGYLVVSLDFQKIGNARFQNENLFSTAFTRLFVKAVRQQILFEPELVKESVRMLESTAQGSAYFGLLELFDCLSSICAESAKPVVLMIDEVDSATDNQVFLDFLAQLRAYYIDRDLTPTFQSVILAGVYDIKNLKQKIRPEEEHKRNSPWNIAANFDIDMSFSAADIEKMLEEYEQDRHTGMHTAMIAGLLYDYTCGYPFLVSRLCQILDETVAGSPAFLDQASAWTKEGVLEAVKMILSEKNTLFESLANKLAAYPKLKELLYTALFSGERISYNPDNDIFDIAAMFGFIKNNRGIMAVANRIFETRLYNLFLSEDEVSSRIFAVSSMDKNQFIQGGQLNMDLVLKKFMACWDELYSSADEKFVEENGRKFFLLYLKPIINGVGNYYVESRTRDNRRTDIIVDYRGKQYIVEIKIWRGNEYENRGMKQLAGYLDAYNAKKGYLVSFNFNKHKITGAREIQTGEKHILEVVV